MLSDTMKRHLRIGALLCALGFHAGCVADAQTPGNEAVSRQPDPHWITAIRYDPRKPFDPGELRALLEGGVPSFRDEQRLQYLLLHAGATGDGSFRDAFDLEFFRDNPNYEMIFATYRYSALGEEEALEEILAVDAAHPSRGGDTAARMVLPWIDEWDRTIAAARRHATGRNDGAAWVADSMFGPVRSILFPESLAAYRDRIATEEKLLHELVSVVADDPELTYDYGSPLWYEGGGKGSGRLIFRVKELPRPGDSPLWFVHLGGIDLSRANLEKQRSFVFEKRGGSFVEVTEQVLPGKWHRDHYLVPVPDNPVILRRSYTEREGDYSGYRAEVRATDLAWKDGTFREAGISETGGDPRRPWWKQDACRR